MPLPPDWRARRRKRRRQALSVALLLLAGGLLWGIRSQTDGDGAEPAASDAVARPETAPLTRIGGVRVLTLRGTNYDVGRQYGLLLKADIRRTLNEWLYGRVLPELGVERELAKSAARAMADFVPQPYMDELSGMASGAGVSLDDLLVLHTFPEMGEWSSSVAFAALPPATRSQDLLLGFGIDTTVQPGLSDLALIYCVDTEGTRPVIGLTLAGLITPWAAMNEQGVSVAMVRGETLALAGPDGVPLLFLTRRMLERSTDMESAIGWLKRANRTVPASFVVAQTTPQLDAAVVESLPTRLARRVPEEGRLVATELFRKIHGDAPVATPEDIAAQTAAAVAAGTAGARDPYAVLSGWLIDHTATLGVEATPLVSTGVVGERPLAVTLQPLAHALRVMVGGKSEASKPVSLSWDPETGAVAAPETALAGSPDPAAANANETPEGR